MEISHEVHRAFFFFSSTILLAGVVIGISISGMIQKNSTYLVLLDERQSGQFSLSTLLWMRAGWIFMCLCLVSTQYLMFESALRTIAVGREPVSSSGSFLTNMIILLLIGLQTLPEFKWQKRRQDNQQFVE